MVAQGLDRYIDWHGYGRDQIHTAIAALKGAGALVGVAHPFSLGEPFCLGCHWHYDILDWNPSRDYIEVWNGPLPMKRYGNSKPLISGQPD